MNRIPYLLLTVVLLVPPAMGAKEQTMAERKQRIMRKYLRENQNVVQSDLVVPDTVDDERIADSERFSQREELLKRQSPAAPPPAPIYRPIPVQAKEDWLLAEDPETDPFADPFALKSEEGTEESKADWYSEWRRQREELAAEAQIRETEAYEALLNRRSGSEGGYGSGVRRPDSSRPVYGSAPRTSYGPDQSGAGPASFGTTRYGSSPSSGMLQWSTPSGSSEGSPSSSSGYTPYRSPYRTQQEQRQQPQPGYPQTQQEEFRRTTPYQKWKNDNKGWDPTADDAYLNELMRRNR